MRKSAFIKIQDEPEFLTFLFIFSPDEIILCVDTFHVRIFFYITCKGVRGYVTDLSKGYTAKPIKYLEIVEPISDFRQMRQVSPQRRGLFVIPI